MIIIGEYKIEVYNDGLWIVKKDGEGGKFSLEEFMEVVEKFYLERL